MAQEENIELGKDEKYLIPVENAPFYAVELSVDMAILAITPSYAAIVKTFALSNTGVQMLTSLTSFFMVVAGILIGELNASKINLKSLAVLSIILVVVGRLLPLLFHNNFIFLIFCFCMVGLD